MEYQVRYAFLRQDWDAVLVGMTLAYSSGVVEGHVNRLRAVQIGGVESLSIKVGIGPSEHVVATLCDC